MFTACPHTEISYIGIVGMDKRIVYAKQYVLRYTDHGTQRPDKYGRGDRNVSDNALVFN